MFHRQVFFLSFFIPRIALKRRLADKVVAANALLQNITTTRSRLLPTARFLIKCRRVYFYIDNNGVQVSSQVGIGLCRVSFYCSSQLFDYWNDTGNF